MTCDEVQLGQCQREGIGSRTAFIVIRLPTRPRKRAVGKELLRCERRQLDGSRVILGLRRVAKCSQLDVDRVAQRHRPDVHIVARERRRVQVGRGDDKIPVCDLSVFSYRDMHIVATAAVVARPPREASHSAVKAWACRVAAELAVMANPCCWRSCGNEQKLSSLRAANRTRGVLNGSGTGGAVPSQSMAMDKAERLSPGSSSNPISPVVEARFVSYRAST